LALAIALGLMLGIGAGVDLHTNGVSLLTDKSDHRAVAAWEAAASVTPTPSTGPGLTNWKCPLPGFTGNSVRTKICPGWYFKVGSTDTGVPASQPPTYPTQKLPNANAKL